MSESKHYTGSCHCGAVRYEVDAAIDRVIACNCSMCRRSGTLLAFVPADAFKLLQGDDRLVDYQFNKHVIHHSFCGTCGIKAFARGQGPQGPMVAINVRCLDDVDPLAFEQVHFDGASK